MLTWGLTAIAVTCCGILLLSLDETFPLARAMQWKYLAGLGAISYGFYFVHALFFQVLDRMAQKYHHTSKALFLLDLVGTIVVAWLSFKYYESPFLKLKNRWAPQEPRAHPHVPEPQPITS